MIHGGLDLIVAKREDYSLLHSFKNHPVFGAAIADPSILPDNFSIYDGREIPNQNGLDTRFNPPLPPMPFSCTGQTGAFESGMQDSALYNPRDLYLNTPPYTDGTGRDIRQMLQVLIDRGVKDDKGSLSPRRSAYFNCYGSGRIDDCDAARIGLWINQLEKRGVYVGSWWYPEFESVNLDGELPVPSFNTTQATLHNHLVLGWRNLNGTIELQDLSWQGKDYATAGVDWIKRDIFNALMRQPYTGCFTITKTQGITPVPIGLQANFDHIVYALNQFIRNLWKV